MRFRLIQAEEANYSTAMMCRAVGVSRAGYYAWRRRPPSARALEDQRLLKAARAVHKETRRAYGYPRMHRELRARGHRVGRHRVARLMRTHGLQGRVRRRFVTTTKASAEHSAEPNILNREFAVERPNAVWVGDTTFVHTREGWLYLAILVDLFSRKLGATPWRCAHLRSCITRIEAASTPAEPIGRRSWTRGASCR